MRWALVSLRKAIDSARLASLERLNRLKDGREYTADTREVPDLAALEAALADASGALTTYLDRHTR